MLHFGFAKLRQTLPKLAVKLRQTSHEGERMLLVLLGTCLTIRDIIAVSIFKGFHGSFPGGVFEAAANIRRPKKLQAGAPGGAPWF